MKNIFLILILIFSKASYANDNNWLSKKIEYTASKQDTWNSLSKKYSIPPTLLQKANPQKKGDNFKNGELIIIPKKDFHILKRGQSLLAIAVANGMTLAEIIEVNNISNPDLVKLGDKIKIVEIKNKSKTSKKYQFSSKSFNLNWPIEGTIVSKYGRQKSGITNNDIIIESDKNTNVTAAASGIIVYAGDRVGQYGNLVIIQHLDNWFTNYGYLTEIKAKKGDLVAAGDIIGSIYSSNPDSKPQLSFGLRLGVTAVNPTKHLKRNRKNGK